MTETIKTCACCNAEFVRPKGISFAVFAKRKFCSPACRSASHKVDMSAAQRQREQWKADDPDEIKVCDECGQTFRRKKTVARAAFRMRRFCGKACLDAGRKAGKVKNAVRWADR